MEDQFSESYIEELAGKYKSGSLNAKEKADFDTWYSNFQDTEYSHSDAADPELVKSRMYAHIISQINLQAPTLRLRIWPRIAVTAAAVAAITVGVWFYYASNLNGRHSGEGRNPESAQYANDIAPGKNTATITLANGKVINLDTNKTSVVVADSVKTMTMLIASTTPRGGTYQFTLPDGTKIWLNADSKLEFPSNFNNAKQRIVKLTGEGYFEVAKDKAHPFIVQTDKQQVEVLGTHFNINSYNDERAIATTLIEGSVQVTSGKLKQILNPGQRALNDGATIEVSEADVETVVAWKNGDFNFKEEDLQTAMLKVARWYNVEVVYDSTAPKDLELGGWVSRKRNISAVLKMIESTGKVHFKVEGRRILVTK